VTPDSRTRLVLLAGDPISHTRGYAEYAAAFAAAELNVAYLPAHVPAGRLADWLDGLRLTRNLAGVVCTIPHKQEAALLARCDDTARRAGAANLLRPNAEGGWDGTMLDGLGFLAACDGAGMTIAGARVQLLGAGGAGRAVAMALASRAPAALAIHDPNEARAASLASAVAREFPEVTVGAALEASDLLVNCSPVGTGDDWRLPLPAELIPAGGAVHDIVNRADTPLLVAARARGSSTLHGDAMMRAQIPLLIRFLFGT